MAKRRFTDCEKWADPWFMDLPVEIKSLWQFVCDRCDNAGVWDVNKRLAQTQIGAPIDWEMAFSLFEGRVQVIANGKKWFLTKFVMFQNPNGLVENSPPHMQVISALMSHGIDHVPYLKTTLAGRVVGRLPSSLQEEEEDKDSPSSKGGVGGNGQPDRKGELVKFLKVNRLAANADAVDEWLGLARDAGCKSFAETTDCLAWAAKRARKDGKEVRFARHIEPEIRNWRELNGPTSSFKKAAP